MVDKVAGYTKGRSNSCTRALKVASAKGIWSIRSDCLVRPVMLRSMSAHRSLRAELIVDGMFDVHQSEATRIVRTVLTSDVLYELVVDACKP